MIDWRTKSVDDCLEKTVTRESKKLQTVDYKPSGLYPIIDQGQAFIAGWTDDESAVIDAGLPVIVFGDHTRALKYVDFPFVRGADGTQLLRPIEGINPRFFYYALRAVDLPSKGYNRHFRELRQQQIPIPLEKEQHDIAQVLRLVDHALSIQHEVLAVLKETKRASMRELFTRGLRGEAQQETEIGVMPVSWRPRTILELCEIWSGGTPRKSDARFWNGDIPWVSGKDLKLPALDDAIDHISADGVDAGSRLVPKGSVLLLIRGMGLAKDLPVAVINRPMAFNQDVKALVSRGEFTGIFIRSAIYFGKDRLLKKIVPSAHGTMTLNLDDVESLHIACPSDQNEANEIVAALEAIERKIDLHRRKRVLLDELFKSLLHQLMTGKIHVADFDLSAVAA